MVITLPYFITSAGKRRCETSRRFYFIRLVRRRGTRQDRHFSNSNSSTILAFPKMIALSDAIPSTFERRSPSVGPPFKCSENSVGLGQTDSRASIAEFAFGCFFSSLKLFVPLVYLGFVLVFIRVLYYTSARPRNSIIVRCAAHRQTFTTIIVIANE